MQNTHVTIERTATTVFFGMDSYRTYWASNLFSSLWTEGQEEDTYEVESRVPLPYPFPFPEHLDENNSVVVNTSIFHFSHKKNGHILKVVSKISLPTPPYSLEHAKITQTELMRESFRKQQEATEFIKYQEELQERLNEETKAREQLALELTKAEGLIDGYADEKAFLEKQLQEKIDVIEHLEQELLCTGNKLQELEAEQQQIQEEKELLSRQKDAMRADAGPVEQRMYSSQSFHEVFLYFQIK